MVFTSYKIIRWTHVYSLKLLKIGFETNKFLTKSLHHIGEFYFDNLFMMTIPMRSVYGFIVFNLCSKNL